MCICERRRGMRGGEEGWGAEKCPCCVTSCCCHCHCRIVAKRVANWRAYNLWRCHCRETLITLFSCQALHFSLTGWNTVRTSYVQSAVQLCTELYRAEHNISIKKDNKIQQLLTLNFRIVAKIPPRFRFTTKVMDTFATFFWFKGRVSRELFSNWDCGMID